MIKYQIKINRLFLFAIIILLSTTGSCIKTSKQYAYYAFTEEDLPKILDFEKGEIIKYQNNLGEIAEYKVNKISDITKRHGSGSTGISDFDIPLPMIDDISFHFDTQISRLSAAIDEENVQIKYGYIRLPKDLYQAQNNKFDEFPSRFIHQIYFSIWNTLEKQNRIYIDFNTQTNTMNINGVTYNDTYTIESGNPNNRFCNGTVNRVYYDLHQGIIGYDEIDGTEWRLIP